MRVWITKKTTDRKAKERRAQEERVTGYLKNMMNQKDNIETSCSTYLKLSQASATTD
jgi:hypothetical protein